LVEAFVHYRFLIKKSVSISGDASADLASEMPLLFFNVIVEIIGVEVTEVASIESGLSK
jgi:hypothetical protein